MTCRRGASTGSCRAACSSDGEGVCGGFVARAARVGRLVALGQGHAPVGRRRLWARVPAVRARAENCCAAQPRPNSLSLAGGCCDGVAGQPER